MAVGIQELRVYGSKGVLARATRCVNALGRGAGHFILSATVRGEDPTCNGIFPLGSSSYNP